MSAEQVVITIIVLVVASIVGHEVWWHMKYKKVYSSVKVDKGVVTEMDYTPSRTKINHHGKTMTTSRTPEKHEVYIKFEHVGQKHFDNERLYQAVRLDDDVTAEYVEVYRVEKDNPRNKTFMRYELKSITTIKGRVITL